MKQLKQLKHLIDAYADNLAAQERVLRQIARLLEREVGEELPPETINSSAIRVCHSGEEYFIPVTEKDSDGKQLGFICDNQWGLMKNTNISMVNTYPSEAIESITKEIHKKD